MSPIPVGVQLYSVREDCARDLPGTLKAIAQMGYDGVEFAGFYGHSARELRQWLDENGLKCCGAHIPLSDLSDETFHQTVEFHLELGNPYLVIPWISEEFRASRTAWIKTAEWFSHLAERLEPYGLRLGYHNHDFEFDWMDGEVQFDIFFSAVSPKVFMQLDTGNAMHGSADPLEYLQRYSDKAVTIHLKEYSSKNPSALPGEGEVPWQDVFALCECCEVTEWYIVEQEQYSMPPLETIARCREILRKMGR
ncbi:MULTISPECIES: sugar phosphate isomerase/epimerase [Anaerolinea]|uniref:sugar phosphate isomerase/epimerase family protein n=1 Tax=Anaerolinea TaxID=233189 RepID=UPI002617CFDE|nr:sugar phosphate isomerase/epimerase [Anaerolinea thermophila]